VPADRVVVELLGDIQAEISRLSRILPREKERKGEKGGSEARFKVAMAVSQHLVEHPSGDMGSLLGNERFYNEIQEKIAAHRHFETRREFENALEEILLGLQSDRASRDGLFQIKTNAN
jgi:hypothetical protein